MINKNNMNIIIENENDERFSIFDYNNLGRIRTVTDSLNNKYFCIRDICNILGILNPRDLLKRLKQGSVDTIYVPIKSGLKKDGTYGIKITPMNFVNEVGLYYAISNSRKPEAKRFMDWVLGDVLPSLNNKGYYLMNKLNKEELKRELKEEFNLEVTSLKDRITELENYKNYIENKISKTNYTRIRDFASELDLGLNLEMTRYLGHIASDVSMKWDIEVSSIYHEKYGSVRLYSREVLKFVFDNYYEEAKEKYNEDYTEEDIDDFYNS